MRKHPGGTHKHTNALTAGAYTNRMKDPDQKTKPKVRKEIQAHPIWSHLKVVLRTVGHSPMTNSPGSSREQAQAALYQPCAPQDHPAPRLLSGNAIQGVTSF